MKIKKITLKEFKRFDDLTIDLGNAPKKVVAMVGPNGCGKSSVIDGALFLQNRHNRIGQFGNVTARFFSKEQDDNFFQNWTNKVKIQFNNDYFEKVFTDKNNEGKGKTIFSFRSSYRYSQNLDVKQLVSLPDAASNSNGASHTIDIDDKITHNYQRLYVYLNTYRKEFGLTDKQAIDKILGDLNTILENCLEIKISDLGDIMEGNGTLFFTKVGQSKTFDFNVLSSGEKEVIDILLDIYIKREVYDDTVYFIDEPELHLNTKIQRKLLIEIEKLIPDNCQLWVSTHSIGFLRAMQEELKDKVQILDFSEKDYFSGTKTITPLKMTRENWQRIFETALEDLTGLVSPHRIIYCEGRPDPGTGLIEQGMDADVYNTIFSEEFNETLFISSGGGGEVFKNSALALSIINKAFRGVNLLVLKDRDTLSDSDRRNFLAVNSKNRMTERREIENYLFDKEVIKLYCEKNGIEFKEDEYSGIVSDVQKDDLKPAIQKIKQLVKYSGTNDDFKRELSKYLTSSTGIYNELKGCVF